VLVKLNKCSNIWLFLSNIQGEIVFQKLQSLWVAKVLMSSYILWKILSCQARVVQEVFNIGLIFIGRVNHTMNFQYSELIYL